MDGHFDWFGPKSWCAQSFLKWNLLFRNDRVHLSDHEVIKLRIGGRNDPLRWSLHAIACAHDEREGRFPIDIFDRSEFMSSDTGK